LFSTYLLSNEHTIPNLNDRADLQRAYQAEQTAQAHIRIQ